MPNNIILMPIFAQVLLTFLVWVTMYKTRIGEMKEKRIHPQKLADKSDALLLLKNVAAPANNFNNLFEIPVLFYLLSIVIYITGITDDILLYLLWGFVASRYIHSYIQITHNTVMQRFKVYAVGSSLMWAGWIIVGVKLYL